VALGTGALGIGVGYVVRKKLAQSQANSVEAKAEKKLTEAKTKQQEMILDAKEKAQKILDDVKKEEQQNRQEIRQMQQRLEKRENMFDQKLMDLEKEITLIKRRMVEMAADLKNFARREEVDTLKKYLEVWNPVNFATHQEVKEIIEEKSQGLNSTNSRR